MKKNKTKRPFPRKALSKENIKIKNLLKWLESDSNKRYYQAKSKLIQLDNLSHNVVAMIRRDRIIALKGFKVKYSQSPNNDTVVVTRIRDGVRVEWCSVGHGNPLSINDSNCTFPQIEEFIKELCAVYFK